MRAHLLYYLIPFFSYLWAVPSVEEIQSIKSSDIKKIPEWMNDKKTKPRFKVMILEKLNILLLSEPEEISIHSDILLGLFSDITKNNKDDKSSYNYLLRKKSCLLLNLFNGTNREKESYEVINKQIVAEDNGEVAAVCIQVMSNFENQKDETNRFLIQLLSSSLKKKKITDDDLDKVGAIIEVLGKFQKKQSYLVLLKVLDSSYPTEIKNKAKKILENFPQ